MVLAIAAVVSLGAGRADAGDRQAGGGSESDAPGAGGVVDVLEVSGWLDPVLVDFVSRSIAAAEREQVTALVLQVNSPGHLVGVGRLAALVDQVRRATVPVTVWVGPAGAKARGGAAALTLSAAEAAMAPRAKLGLDRDLLDDLGVALPADIRTDRTVDDEDARALGLVDRPAPTLLQFIGELPGVETEPVEGADTPTRRPVTPVRFRQLSVVSQLFHTVGSPAVAYLLVTAAIFLLVFELFTAGVGVAGVVGAGCGLLAGYGLWVLPTDEVALALLAVSTFGFAIDVQTGVPRVWTGIATVCFVAASLTLYDGIALSWITLLAGIAGLLVGMIGGMPAMVRTRFSTPTIGREGLVDARGEAVGPVAPDGVVRIEGALWRARTLRATPIAGGEAVRVVEIDGLLLEVRPDDDDE